MYQNYVDEVINMIFRNTDFSERNVFGDRGTQIGKEIYNKSGYKGLYTFMDILVQTLMESEYSSEYLNDLRELECSFNGICDEWQM